MPGSIIFTGCVISRAPIGLSFLEARNKTFPVARKLPGLQRGGTKWLQSPLAPAPGGLPGTPPTPCRCRRGPRAQLRAGGRERSSSPAYAGPPQKFCISHSYPPLATPEGGKGRKEAGPWGKGLRLCVVGKGQRAEPCRAELWSASVVLVLVEVNA